MHGRVGQRIGNRLGASTDPLGVDQLLYRNVQRFRGGLAFKAHRLCASHNSRLESNKEEEKIARLESNEEERRVEGLTAGQLFSVLGI